MDLQVRIDQQVRFVTRDGAAVLLQLQRGSYQSLNGSGAAIWNDIGDGATVAQLVTRMCARHPAVPRERVESDMQAFLTQLQSRGLVKLEQAR